MFEHTQVEVLFRLSYVYLQVVVPLLAPFALFAKSTHVLTEVAGVSANEHGMSCSFNVRYI